MLKLDLFKKDNCMNNNFNNKSLILKSKGKKYLGIEKLLISNLNYKKAKSSLN